MCRDWLWRTGTGPLHRALSGRPSKPVRAAAQHRSPVAPATDQGRTQGMAWRGCPFRCQAHQGPVGGRTGARRRTAAARTSGSCALQARVGLPSRRCGLEAPGGVVGLRRRTEGAFGEARQETGPDHCEACQAPRTGAGTSRRRCGPWSCLPLPGSPTRKFQGRGPGDENLPTRTR